MAEAVQGALYFRVRKILFVSIAVVLFLLVLQIVFRLVILPRMEIAQILLECNLNLSDQEILMMGGLTGSENYLSLDAAELVSRYESSPLIRKAYVEKQFPATLKLVLYGRSALGTVFVEGGREVMVFDEYGVLYNAVDSSPYRDLPVLSGLDLEDITALPEALTPFLRDLMTLKADSPLLFNQISELSVKKLEGALYEVLLYTSAYGLPVLVSTGLNDGVMKKILLVLDSLDTGTQAGEIEYADFRTDQVVLKIREGN
ncbi:MAG: FtsQ-type POTRA domain-containing protein [Spirochaetales bacterium]|nr:FtsQ-type POTRA domain-containing protein [Spirochaetales bacterium]